MDILILGAEMLGSACMGIFVAWIGFFFINRDTTFNAKEFGEFIAIFFGGVIVQLYSAQSAVISPENSWVFWIYPLGLVLGMIGYHLNGGNIKAKFQHTSKYLRGIPALWGKKQGTSGEKEEQEAKGDVT
jgi:hypothetical protein